MKKKPLAVLCAAACLAGAAVTAPPGLRAEPPGLVVEGSYLIRNGESRDVARGIALYRAKRKAVEAAAGRLAAGDLPARLDGPREREVLSLAAERVDSRIVEERELGNEPRLVVKIEAVVDDGDFAMADVRALREERRQLSLPYREEMGQPIGNAVSPGGEIARAYGLIRNGHWRLAAIYLDNLAGKYPYWGEVYMAQAMVFEGIHRPKDRERALSRACVLECEEACGDTGLLLASGSGRFAPPVRQP